VPNRPRLRLAAALTAVLCALGAGAAIVSAQKGSDVESITATLKNAQGTDVATVEFRKSPRSAVKIIVKGTGLPPGFHGFHVHETGLCDAPAFMTAKGHLKNDGQSHGAHKGDFPSLLVKRDGTVSARFETDTFGFETLKDADGSAVMIHASPDNFGNIPPRYAPNGTDQTTKDTGDSGARIACGSIR
jgi:Cu-Zn family superoxide dismutase